MLNKFALFSITKMKTSFGNVFIPMLVYSLNLSSSHPHSASVATLHSVADTRKSRFEELDLLQVQIHQNVVSCSTSPKNSRQLVSTTNVLGHDACNALAPLLCDTSLLSSLSLADYYKICSWRVFDISVAMAYAMISASCTRRESIVYW
jgi:hypothetical protein